MELKNYLTLYEAWTAEMAVVWVELKTSSQGVDNISDFKISWKRNGRYKP